MKTPQTFVIFACLLALSILNFGCVKRDIDKISEAQDCLDQSDSTNSLACMEKVEGLESAGAHLIRCSAYFIDQGFAEPSRLASVAQQVTNGAGDPAQNTFGALSIMGFVASKYDMTTNHNMSELAFSSCAKSKSGGLIYLSSMSRISTSLLKDLAFTPGGTSPTATDIENTLCDPALSSTTKIAIGMAAISAYQNDCITRKTESDDVCQQYAAALATSSDPEDVGELLADNLCTP